MPRGAHYTEKEARERLPTVIKNVALSAVDITILIEALPMNHRDVEMRVFQLCGLVGYMSRLFHIVWREEAKRRSTARGAV